MTRSRLFLLGTVWLALAAFGGYEFFVAAQQRAQLDAAQKKSAELRAEATRLKQEASLTTQDLAQAERQLAELSTMHRAASPEAQARQGEITVWLKQVKHLRRLFDEKPEQRIPEMKLLDDQDWLRVAKRANFDSEEGLLQALASVRDTAVHRYRTQLAPALRQFAKTATDQTTPDILALIPLLGPDVDPSLLSRYELTKTTYATPRPGLEWHVSNKAPVDPLYDQRFDEHARSDGSSGMSGSSAPTAWIPNFAERFAQARREFSLAKNGAKIETMSDAIPFFSPALDPRIVERIRAQDAKNGKK